MIFGCRQEQLEDCEVVHVGLDTISGKSFELKILSVPHICEPLFNVAVDLERYPHLKDIDFASDLEHDSQFSPDILLGSDQYCTLLIKSTSGLVAVNSQLGWILFGPVVVMEAMSQHTALITHVLRVDGMTESKCLERELHSFWEIESLGIVENYGVPNVSKLKEIDRLTKFLLLFIYANPIYINTYLHLYIPTPYI